MKRSVYEVRQFLAVNRRRQLPAFDGGLEAVDHGLVDVFKDLGQFLMDRFAMVAHLGAEITNQTTVAKVGLFEKVDLNVEPLAKPIQRLCRIIPERLVDVLSHHREISNQEFEAERVF